MFRRFSFLIPLALMVGAACKSPVLPELTFPREEVALLPLRLPDDSLHALYSGIHPTVYQFYRARHFEPLWVQAPASADSVMRFIAQVRYGGLLPGDYHWSGLQREIVPPWNPDGLLRRDLLLSDAYSTLYHDLARGRTRVPSDVQRLRTLEQMSISVTARRVIGDLRAAEPDHWEYRGLKTALRNLIDTADSLTRAQWLAGVSVSHDSPALRTLETIEINLERWRWEKRWTDRYIYVNIPALAVEVVNRGQIVLTSRAIVGKPSAKTPVFSSEVQCFITYPYWHVPRSIAVGEFLPFIQRDTTFLGRNNFEVLDRHGAVLNADSIPWHRYSKDNFPVVLRQREGNENSLGIIKFQFDNPHAVFIHDTNAPRLFNRKDRALSHGCIRMEKAVDLAHYLVTGASGVRSPQVEGYLREKQRHTVDLRRPIPVHIRYFTAGFRAGRLVLYDDVYGNDAALHRSLRQPRTGVTAIGSNPGAASKVASGAR